MSYFKKFPYSEYTIGKNSQILKDITVRAKFADVLKTQFDFYSTYSIQEGERPEHVAYKFYGDASLHWIVLLYNEIHDPFFGWPQSQNDLIEYCKKTYGEDVMYQVRHYERDGLIIGEYREFNKADPLYVWIPPENPGPQDPTVYPVSHIEWEEQQNDTKREIRILEPRLVDAAIEAFERIISV